MHTTILRMIIGTLIIAVFAFTVVLAVMAVIALVTWNLSVFHSIDYIEFFGLTLLFSFLGMIVNEIDNI